MRRRGDSTIPYWLAIVLPLALLLISIIVGECVLAKHWHGTITSAGAAAFTARQ